MMKHFFVPVNNFSDERWLQPLLMMQHYLRYISRKIDGISSVVPDNIFGQETVKSVRSFQQYFGLPVTGVIDYPTWEMIIFVYEELANSNK